METVENVFLLLLSFCLKLYSNMMKLVIGLVKHIFVQKDNNQIIL